MFDRFVKGIRQNSKKEIVDSIENYEAFVMLLNEIKPFIETVENEQGLRERTRSCLKY